MKRPLVYGMLILTLSIAIYRYFDVFAWLIASIPVISIVFIYYRKIRWQGAFAFIFFWILGFLLLFVSLNGKSKVLNYVAATEQNVVVYGTVTDKGMTATGKQKLNIRAEKLEYGKYTIKKGFTVQATLKEGEFSDIGAKVVLKGAMQMPEGRRNPGGFDEYTYFKTRKIDFKMFPEETRNIGKTTNIRVIIGNLKERFISVFDETLPKTEAGLMKAMILGDSSDLDEAVSALYKNSGIYHIIVISGYHITLLFMIVYFVLSKCMPLKWASFTSICMIILYCMLSGMGVSSVRAVIMTTAVIIGRLFTRDGDLASSAAFSAVLLMIYEPFYIFDAGFQLSFASVFALAYCTEPLNRLIGWILTRTLVFRRFANYNKFRNALASGIAVSIATTPIIVHYFNYISVYSVIVNLLIIPFSSLIIILGFVMVFLGAINIYFAHLISGVLYFILKYYEYVCVVFSALPFSKIIMASKPFYITSAFYLAYIAGIKALKSFGAKFKKFSKVFAVTGIVFILIFSLESVYPRGFTLTMLDVGQGDAFIIENNRETYVIDGGGWNNREFGKNTGAKVLTPYLEHKGINKLDMVFLSHTDADHSLGIAELLYKKKVDKLALPYTVDFSGEDYKLIEKAAYENNVDIIYLKQGDIVKTQNGIEFVMLSPEKEAYYDNPNEGSMVIKVIYGRNSFLFTGDIGFYTERKLIEGNYNLSADILKIPHHGSKYSSSDEFLEAVSPKAAIVSASKTNAYNHPSPEVLEKLKQYNVNLYSTSMDGAVIIKSNGKELKFEKMVNGY